MAPKRIPVAPVRMPPGDTLDVTLSLSKGELR